MAPLRVLSPKNTKQRKVDSPGLQKKLILEPNVGRLRTVQALLLQLRAAFIVTEWRCVDVMTKQENCLKGR